MLDVLFIYTLGVLATSSLLMAWFGSGLALHVADLLRLIFPNSKLLQEATQEFVASSKEDWVIAVETRAMSYPWWVQLLTELLFCRICLSFHASFWCSLALVLTTDATWLFIPVAVLTWPYLVNVLLKKVI
jgi:hypothetical protein